MEVKDRTLGVQLHALREMAGSLELRAPSCSNPAQRILNRWIVRQPPRGRLRQLKARSRFSPVSANIHAKLLAATGMPGSSASAARSAAGLLRLVCASRITPAIVCACTGRACRFESDSNSPAPRRASAARGTARRAWSTHRCSRDPLRPFFAASVRPSRGRQIWRTFEPQAIAPPGRSECVRSGTRSAKWRWRGTW